MRGFSTPRYSISQNICTRFFALLCFVVAIHWLLFPYPSGLLDWHCSNLTIAPVSAKQPWWIWINTSCEFIMNDCITTTKQSTTKPCAYFWDILYMMVRWLTIQRKEVLEKNSHEVRRQRYHFGLSIIEFTTHCYILLYWMTCVCLVQWNCKSIYNTQELDFLSANDMLTLLEIFDSNRAAALF